MQNEKISQGLDWLHERLSDFAWRWFLLSLALLLIALGHFVAVAYTDAYGARAMAQYARAAAENSMWALPAGQYVAILAIVSTLLCIATVPVQLFLWLRARLWRAHA